MYNEVFDHIDEVSESIDYWLVRTDSGKYYDFFYSQEYIAIDWNYITLQDFENLTRNQIKEKIARNEDLNLDDPSGLRRATLITNKLFQFKELRSGDVVIIPSRHSGRLAFGIVQDQAIYTETNQIQEVTFYKRRRVKWYAEYSTSKLDPVFFKMIHTHHVISKINSYDKYIDRVMHSVYKKKGFAHISLEIQTNKDVDVETLINFVSALQNLTISINDSFAFDESIKDNSIRLNIQSPGIMEMKLLRGRSLMMLAVVLNIMACGNMENIEGTFAQKEKIREFIEYNDSTLDTIRHGVDVMEIDMSRFNNIY